MQINLLRHQCTELPAGKYKKKKWSVKSRQTNYKQHGNENSQVQSQHKKWFDVKHAHQSKDRCSKCGGDSVHVEGFQCPAKKFQCKACHKFGHFTSICYQKKQAPFKPRKPKGTPTTSKCIVYAKESATLQSIWRWQFKWRFLLLAGQSEVHTSKSSENSQVPTHLITNLAYKLKPHHTRNLYLRARLDTCADVNIMPASMYRLVLKIQKWRSLPSVV